MGNSAEGQLCNWWVTGKLKDSYVTGGNWWGLKELVGNSAEGQLCNWWVTGK